jgi:hypothetical protein
MPSISKNLLISASHIASHSEGAVFYGFEKSLNSDLLPPFMVFVAQDMCCELNFQCVSNCVYVDELNLRPDEPRIAVGTLGPSVFRSNFALGHIA